MPGTRGRPLEGIPAGISPAHVAKVTRSPGYITGLGLPQSALRLQHRITTTAACNRTSDRMGCSCFTGYRGHTPPKRKTMTPTWAMNDSANRPVPSPWGDDMESALIAQDRVLRSRAKAASSPHVERRTRAGAVVAMCTAALLAFLLILLLVSHACCTGNNAKKWSPLQNVRLPFGYRSIKQTQTGATPPI